MIVFTQYPKATGIVLKFNGFSQVHKPFSLKSIVIASIKFDYFDSVDARIGRKFIEARETNVIYFEANACVCQRVWLTSSLSPSRARIVLIYLKFMICC